MKIQNQIQLAVFSVEVDNEVRYAVKQSQNYEFVHLKHDRRVYITVLSNMVGSFLFLGDINLFKTTCKQVFADFIWHK